uniref:alginate export family protein n=1 Tax=Cellvibrio fontiphilus TaxID=1815559 RepID=UPI002B4C1B7D|nr:alginate export family protein [Cellvibrio fontiphilus]
MASKVLDHSGVVKMVSLRWRNFITAFLCLLSVMGTTVVSVADTGEGDLVGRRLVSVTVKFDNSQQQNSAYKNAVLKAFGIYPGGHYDASLSALMLNKVKRLNFVKSASYTPRLAANGQVELVLDIIITDKVSQLSNKPIGVLVDGNLSEFPTFYADDKTILQGKLENKSMVFSNSNAFFGRPDVLTAGNPLALSPSGESSSPDTWLESSVEAGTYGLHAFNERISGFVGATFIASGSWGPELFTDETRAHLDVEDAYLGFTGNSTTEQGGLRQINVLVGRKAFQVDNGMILRLGSANGGERAALQSNPRNAADQLLLMQLIHDEHKLELFQFDPDELEELDSRTVIRGINYESRVASDFRVGAMYLWVPESNFSYFTETAVLSRDGLELADLRFAYDPPTNQSGFYAQAELARQSHQDFDMKAYAGYMEVGYRFSGLVWRPAVSYRYSRFTGDKPDTSSFERWDPLFAGGAGDEWVQGLNQYKVVQTSNVIGHRIMGRLNISPQLELTPQLWFFMADNPNNLGGAQALSVLSSRDLGREINLTARYISSASLIFVFSAAYTKPGEAVRDALNDDYSDWISASALVIARF